MSDSSPWRDRSPSDMSIIWVLLLLVMGLISLGAGGYLFIDFQSQAQGDFEQTEATVLSSEVQRAGTTGDSTNYYANITYEYTVEGKTYRSSNVFPGSEIKSKIPFERANTIVESHPEGAEVTVYYNPDSPSEAFLIKEDPPLMGLVVAVSLGGLLIYAAMRNLLRRMNVI